MSVRVVTDDAGVAWQVWQVIPGSPRLAGPATGQMPNVWGGAPRLVEIAATTSEEYERGWLVFMAESERRRLAPIPAGWEELDEVGLLGLLGRAGG